MRYVSLLIVDEHSFGFGCRADAHLVSHLSITWIFDADIGRDTLFGERSGEMIGDDWRGRAFRPSRGLCLKYPREQPTEGDPFPGVGPGVNDIQLRAS
jgi:hypothetical protein